MPQFPVSLYRMKVQDQCRKLKKCNVVSGYSGFFNGNATRGKFSRWPAASRHLKLSVKQISLHNTTSSTTANSEFLKGANELSTECQVYSNISLIEQYLRNWQFFNFGEEGEE